MKKYHKTKSATQLVISTNSSTRRSAAICQQIFKNGINIETSTQSGVYRVTFKEAVKIRELLKETLHLENWCMHFDGKRIYNKEY